MLSSANRRHAAFGLVAVALLPRQAIVHLYSCIVTYSCNAHSFPILQNAQREPTEASFCMTIMSDELAMRRQHP